MYLIKRCLFYAALLMTLTVLPLGMSYLYGNTITDPNTLIAHGGGHGHGGGGHWGGGGGHWGGHWHGGHGYWHGGNYWRGGGGYYPYYYYDYGYPYYYYNDNGYPYYYYDNGPYNDGYYYNDDGGVSISLPGVYFGF